MLLTTTRRGTRLPTWTFIYVLIRDWAFGAQNQIPQHGRSVQVDVVMASTVEKIASTWVYDEMVLSPMFIRRWQ